MQTPNPSLASKAFGEHADPNSIVAYDSHNGALQFLTASLDQSNGIAMLQGPAGSGKSTVIRAQADWSARTAAVAVLDDISLSPRRLVSGILSQFGVDNIPQHDEQALQALNQFLARQARGRPAPVLFLDNFDCATESTRRLLNWLAALEEHGRYALRIVLTGLHLQSVLFGDQSVRNLAVRNPATYSLNPLTGKETVSYLRTKWIAAGGDESDTVFSIDICDRLHELSQGWPGRLNEHAFEATSRLAAGKTDTPIPRVIVTRDGETVAKFRLTPRSYIIGRNELADINIEDKFVSKMHAMLQVYRNAIVLFDLNSTNGTTVNSTEVQRRLLLSNDIISLGRYRLKIENAPPVSAEVDEKLREADTQVMQHLDDIRRIRARHTIRAMKHK